MKEDTISLLFHVLSRLIIIFSIFVLVASLVVKFNQSKIQPSVKNFQQATPSLRPTTFLEKVSTAAANLNLEGPLVCNYSYPQGSMSARIKNKNAFARIQSQDKIENVLLKGDCAYLWETDRNSGQKICGISSYLSIFDSLSRFGLVNLDSIFQYLSQLGLKNNFAVNEANLKSFIESCKKQEVPETFFDLPKNVLFKNIK